MSLLWSNGPAWAGGGGGGDCGWYAGKPACGLGREVRPTNFDEQAKPHHGRVVNRQVNRIYQSFKSSKWKSSDTSFAQRAHEPELTIASCKASCTYPVLAVAVSWTPNIGGTTQSSIANSLDMADRLTKCKQVRADAIQPAAAS